MESSVKVKVQFTLEQATKAQRGSRSIAYSFFNLGTRWGWVVNVTLRPLYLGEREPVPVVEEAGCVPGPVLTGFDPRAVQSVASHTD